MLDDVEALPKSGVLSNRDSESAFGLLHQWTHSGFPFVNVAPVQSELVGDSYVQSCLANLGSKSAAKSVDALEPASGPGAVALAAAKERALRDGVPQVPPPSQEQTFAASAVTQRAVGGRQRSACGSPRVMQGTGEAATRSWSIGYQRQSANTFSMAVPKRVSRRSGCRHLLPHF